MRRTALLMVPALAGLLHIASCKKDSHDMAGPGPIPGNNTGAFQRVTGFTESITDASFADDMNGMIVGAYGFAARTTDGGKTWTVLAKPTTHSLLSAFCLSANEFFAARNWLHYSGDGGNSFANISNTLGQDNSIKSIRFFNSYEGFIIKGNSIYETTDGGDTWTGKAFSPGYPHRMQFITGDVGYVWGGITYDGFSKGELYKTTDGGANWTSLITTEVPEIVAAHFVSQNVGYYADHNRNIFRTTDGGLTWNLVKAAFAGYITDMVFTGEHSGYIATYDGGIHSTTDDGATWKLEFSAPDTAFNRIIATPAGTILATGNDGLLLRK